MLSQEQVLAYNTELKQFAAQKITESDPFLLAKGAVIKAREDLLATKERAASSVKEQVDEKGHPLGVTASNAYVANFVRADKYKLEDAKILAQMESYKWDREKERINTIKLLLKEKTL